MKKLLKWLIILAAAIIAIYGTYKYGFRGRTCCAPPPQEIDRSKLPPPPTTEKSCLEQNGKWEEVGLSIEKKCNLPTADAGNYCTDNSQCEGACIGNSAYSRSGKCSDWRLVFGCQYLVYNGRVPGLICAD